MGIFATRVRHDAVGPETAAELSEELRPALPPRFEAVGEALASGPDPVDACGVLGRDLALDGFSLEEVLDGLRTSCRLVRGTEPGFEAVRAIAVAWSESTLGYLHQLSCEDPLTGLASIAHVRTRLSELYRVRPPGSTGSHPHVLVVVDFAPAGSDRGAGGRADVLTHALRASRLGQTARTVFSGTETIGSLGSGRIVVIAERDDRLGRRTALLRRMLSTRDGHPRVRVWVEGLPGTDRTAAALLDELVRL
ncbi:MAG: hypothetical protein JWN22_3660 [Nocardioides sp.]|jgi:hypothetical protein|nr:hypothetical protein [Nocardioides sp.]